MATRQRRGGFPIAAVALLGLGAYWLYSQHQASQTVAPGTPATLPTTPVSTATANQLTAPAASTLTARQIVQQAAQSINTPSWMAFAANGSDADIQGMANIIQGEWAQYGKCKTTQCQQYWSYIVAKYHIQ